MLLALPAVADGISGTYVGKASNGAFLIQIVETADRHLTGRYEEVILQPTGKIDDMNAMLTGAADNQTVVLTIKPTEFLLGSIAASGTIQGRLLHLSGGARGNNFSLNLTKSDEDDFHMQVALLMGQARQINDARARQEAVQQQIAAAQQQEKYKADQTAKLQNVTNRMAIFNQNAESLLPSFATAEQRYKNITQRLRAALARERSIYGEGQASVARSQISVAITQANIESGQIHMSDESTYSDFNRNYENLAHDSESTNKFCERAHIVAATDHAPQNLISPNDACMKFIDVTKIFQQRVTDLRVAFAHLEGVWNTEHHAQEEIEKASEVAAQ